MNVTCGSCPAKYAVPDDKVRGKKARIKCKHCGADILVDGTTLGASERPSGSPASAPKGSAGAPAATLPPEAAQSLRAAAPNAPAQPPAQAPSEKPAAAPVAVAAAPKATAPIAPTAAAPVAPRAAGLINAPLGSRQSPPPGALTSARATPIAKIQPKTVSVPRVMGADLRPSDTAPQVAGTQAPPAPTPAGQTQPAAAAKPAGKPMHKMTMVGLAGPAPGSHSPDLAKANAPAANLTSSAPAGPASPDGLKAKPAIGLAAVRGANQTLLGGTLAPKFEPPAIVTSPHAEPPPQAGLDPSAPAPATQVWTVAFLDGTQREASVTQLQDLFAAGKISDENLLWQEGMTDWVALRNLPALRKSLMGRASMRPPESEPVTQNTYALGEPLSKKPAPAAVTQAAGEPQTVPESGSAHEGIWKEPGSWTGGGNRPTAQEVPTRLDDEISKALGASVAESEMLDSEVPPPPSHAAPTRPSPPPQSPSAAPAAAPPPDAAGSARQNSPKSKPSSATSSTGSTSSKRPLATAERAVVPTPEVLTEPRARRWPSVLGLLIAAGIVAVVAIYKTQAPPQAFSFLDQTLPAPLRQALGGVAPPLQVPAASSKTEPTFAPEAPAPSVTVAASASSEFSTAAVASGAPPAAAAASGATQVTPVKEPEGKPLAGEKEKREASDEKAASEFDEAKAQSELARLSAGIQKCRGTEPPGKGQVRVTFGPAGEATAASIAGQYAASDAGLCVIDIFRQAKIRAFSGEAVTVARDFALQ